MGWTKGRRAAGLLLLLTAAAAGCADEADHAAGDSDDLTSLTARQRILELEGLVYVEPGTSDDAILTAVHVQTQSAFGALLASKVAVRSREVQNVDPSTFVKRDVRVVGEGGGDPRPMVEVKYAYKDEAVIPVDLARHSSLSLALLSKGGVGHVGAIVEACTKNDTEARNDAQNGLLWYDFDPTRASCRRAIDREQRTIDEDTARLEDPRSMVARSRVERVYLPTAMRLGRADTAERATYPEYDRLFSGGESGALVVELVVGRLEHDHVEAIKDDGYYQWMDTLGTIFTAHPEFTLTEIEPRVDVSTVTVGGRRIENLSFADFVRWTVYQDGFPEGLSASDRKTLAKTVADQLDKHWVTFEKKVKVSVGDAPPRDLTLRIETYFGVEEDIAPHKRALSRGDVVVYNGHSYIGYGPLDPGNFRPSSFTRGYQLVWFDSCVSYNYYEKDFFALKEGGSKNLDMITNGLEAPTYQSGEAQGGLIARLLDGSMPSYQTLLESARSTDSLRVVDGEIDNAYHPSRVNVRVTPP